MPDFSLDGVRHVYSDNASIGEDIDYEMSMDLRCF